MPFDTDSTHSVEFTIGNAKLSDIQIEEGDLKNWDEPIKTLSGNISNFSYELKCTLKNIEDFIESCGFFICTKDCPKPFGKSNNWYRLHGYKMNRRIGRKWISRNMHELNNYFRAIDIHDIELDSDGYYHGKIGSNLEAEWYSNP